MGDVIQFDDVEAALVTWLTTRLSARNAAAKVKTKRVAGDPSRLVRLSVTGGSRAHLIEDRPVVVFECWEAKEPAASDLAKIVRAEVQSLDNTLVGGTYLSWRSEVSRPVSYPHPDTDIPRYQHTQQLAVIGYKV